MRYVVWVVLDSDPNTAMEQIEKIDAHLSTLQVEYSSTVEE